MLAIDVLSAPFRFPLLTGKNWCSTDSVRPSGGTFMVSCMNAELYKAAEAFSPMEKKAKHLKIPMLSQNIFHTNRKFSIFFKDLQWEMRRDS